MEPCQQLIRTALEIALEDVEAADARLSELKRLYRELPDKLFLAERDFNAAVQRWAALKDAKR